MKNRFLYVVGWTLAGAAFWIALSRLTPTSWKLNSAVTPFIAAVMGIYWAAALNPASSARSLEDGPSAGGGVNRALLLGWYSVVLGVGALLWWRLSR